MFGAIILGIIAGVAAPFAEPKLKEFLEGVLLNEVPVDPKEMALLSFAICVLVAALLAAVLFRANAVALALGATLGVFGPRLWDKWQARKAPDYDS